MFNFLKLPLWIVLLSELAWGAPKPHVISFGKPVSAKWFVGADENHSVEIKVRALYVDARAKEFTSGPVHEVTDHFFVVRRVFHINDALPGEDNFSPRWRWQRGGWLLVDRVSGHVTQVSLPDFDTYYSSPSWYRDYVAYCASSDDGKKLYAIVAQLGRRKAILKKSISEITGEGSKTEQPEVAGYRPAVSRVPDSDMPDSLCPAPSWERQPTRVTFSPAGKAFTYSVRGHEVEVLNANDDEATEE